MQTEHELEPRARKLGILRWPVFLSEAEALGHHESTSCLLTKEKRHAVRLAEETP